MGAVQHACRCCCTPSLASLAVKGLERPSLKPSETLQQASSSVVASSTSRAGAYRAGAFGSRYVHGGVTFSARPSSSSSEESLDVGANACRRGTIRVDSSKNGATNAMSRQSVATTEVTEIGRLEEIGKRVIADDEDREQENGGPGVSLTGAPSCSLPNFSAQGSSVTIFNPLVKGTTDDPRPLLLYVPGMDGSGQGIRSQLPYLCDAGYDIRCVYIPSSDRSSWQQLVDIVLPLVVEEVRGVNGKNRHLTVLGESFGGGLAIRLAKAGPSLVSRLVLVNPATNFPNTNYLGSLAAQTGLLAQFPEPLYQIAQDILLPFMVKRNRVSQAGTMDFLSPLDFVPAACASWRMSMLNDNSGLDDEDLRLITTPTLLIVSGKDRIVSSITEGARLERMLPNSKRVVLPESGHTALFEDLIDIADVMLANGFGHPAGSNSFRSLSLNTSPPSLVAKKEEAVTNDMLDELGLLLEPWRILTSPLVSGTENLPKPSSEPRRPLLFVGNHTMFGVYDSPVLVYELYIRGFRCRGLAHPGHWIAGVGGIFERYGNVKATKVAAYKLLKQGENVLLFPGGAREVCKRKGEEYKLLWKETADFVRMAIRHKAIIVPFGALGGDEAYDIAYDANDIMASPIGPLVEQAYRRVGIDPVNIYPITSLPGTKIPSPVPIPTIERIYFHFAESVDTSYYASSINDREEVQALYEMVKARVEDSIDLLKVARSKDPERELPVRLLAKLGRLLPEFLPRMPTLRS